MNKFLDKEKPHLKGFSHDVVSWHIIPLLYKIHFYKEKISENHTLMISSCIQVTYLNIFIFSQLCDLKVAHKVPILLSPK